MGERCLLKVESKLDRRSINVTDIPKRFSRVTATTAMVPNTEVALQACLSSDILFDCKLQAAIYWEEVGIESPGGIQQADGSIICRRRRVAHVVCWVGYGLSLSHKLI